MWVKPKKQPVIKKAQEEAVPEDLETAVEEAESPKGFTEADAGPIIEDAGQATGLRVQRFALQYGWEGPVIENTDDPQYYEYTQSAEQHMQSLAPAGYQFGTSESGDWGLWEGEADALGGETVSEEVLPDVTVQLPEEAFDSMEDIEQITQDIGAEPQPEPVAASHRVKAQAPTTPPPQVGPNQVARWNEVKQQWEILPKDQSNVTPEATQIAKQTLEQVTVWSEFNDELRPERDGLPRHGDRVYVKGGQQWGTVVRVEGNALRVAIPTPDNPENINTYWLHEIELR